MVFTKLLLESALVIRLCNCEAASEPLLPKVARCIPVLPSHSIGKCAARVLKSSEPIEQDEKMSFALFAFEVEIFQLLWNFLTAKPIRLLSWVTWTLHEYQNIFTKWLPHTFMRPKSDRPQYILKTRTSEQFSFATAFHWTYKTVEINVFNEKFFSDQK